MKTQVLLDRLAAQVDGRPLPDLKHRFAEVQRNYPARGKGMGRKRDLESALRCTELQWSIRKCLTLALP